MMVTLAEWVERLNYEKKPVQRVAVTIDFVTDRIVGICLVLPGHYVGAGVQTLWNNHLVCWRQRLGDEVPSWSARDSESGRRCSGRYQTRWVEVICDSELPTVCLPPL